jgi:DNA-binding winged helix-turn-helix (wHTH) protein/TolB-like protein/Flp pilus assembly protein TadD
MQVGGWSVDAGLNELSGTDEVIRLEPKVMEVLLFLAAHPGEVVSREALLEAIWPDVVVGDDALTQAVIKLRKAFGDNPRDPSYIQTIPKRGYRLLAPVMNDAKQSASQVTATEAAPRPWRLYSGMAILALALFGLGLWATINPPQQSAPLAVLPDGNSLGVVIKPFKTLETTPESTSLAIGLASELASDLSRLSALRVIAYSKGNPSPDINYVVDGEVQQATERLRIHVHLLDARSRQEIWGVQFDRPTHDLLDVQSELSRRLMAVLPLKLSEAERSRAAHRYTRSLEAYDLFLRAQSALLTRSQSDNETARNLYRQAIQKDPAFARAYAGLALTYAADYRNQWAANGQEALARAFEMAETARQIDPDIPEIYWTLGFVFAQRKEHDAALTQLSTALSLNPSYADAYALKGGIYTYMGRPADSLPLLRTAQRLNPDSGYLYFQLLGRAYFFLNDFDQARINLSEALSRNNADLESHVYLAAVLAEQGDRSGATWEVEEIRSLQPGFQIESWLRTYPLSDNALRQRLVVALNNLGK